MVSNGVANLLQEWDPANSHQGYETTLLEKTAPAVIGLTADGAINRWTPEAGQLFGFAAEEILGQSMTLLWPPQARQQVRVVLQRLFQSPLPLQFQTVHRLKDGQQILGQSTIGPTGNGSQLGGFSWKVQAHEYPSSSIPEAGQEALQLPAASNGPASAILTTTQGRGIQDEPVPQAFQEQLQRILVANPQVVYVAFAIRDKKVSATWISDNSEAVFGYPAGPDFSLEWWLEKVHAADRAKAQRQFQEFFGPGGQAGEGDLSYEYRFHHANGTCRWVRVNLRPFQRGPAGDLVEVVGSLTDITDLRLEELEILRLNQTLARKNEELEALLHHSQRLASLGTLAAGLAHEIRNPLVSLRLCLYSLRHALAAHPDLEEDFQTVTQVVDKLEYLANNYLNFARLPARQLQFLSIKDVLASPLQLLEPRLRQKSIEVQCQYSPDLPTVQIGRVEIEQVLLNLISNASDALPQGGRIRLSAQCLQDMTGKRFVVVRVEDNGPGIPHELAKRIFSPFFTTKEGGNGLGLHISSQLAVRNGGRLVLESTSKAGTCFALWIPESQNDEHDPSR